MVISCHAFRRNGDEVKKLLLGTTVVCVGATAMFLSYCGGDDYVRGEDLPPEDAFEKLSFHGCTLNDQVEVRSFSVSYDMIGINSWHMRLRLKDNRGGNLLCVNQEGVEVDVLKMSEENLKLKKSERLW